MDYFPVCIKMLQPALDDQLMPELRQKIIGGEILSEEAWQEAIVFLKKLRVVDYLSLDDQALASAYWWLAMTRKDFPERLKEAGSDFRPTHSMAFVVK